MPLECAHPRLTPRIGRAYSSNILNKISYSDCGRMLRLPDFQCCTSFAWQTRSCSKAPVTLGQVGVQVGQFSQLQSNKVSPTVESIHEKYI
eukprot:1142362-Pelagomonas_calceolata.AAC.4